MKINRNVPKILKLDSYRLMQILLNLAANAVKFTDRGSVNLTIEWIPDRERVSEQCFEPHPYDDDNELDEDIFERNQHFATLDKSFHFLTSSHKNIVDKPPQNEASNNNGILKVIISDTGCGISKKNVANLFTKFSQLNLDSSERNSGSGLGLYVTKELCQRMKGDIKAFSKEGKGSCFMFCLPAEPIANYLPERTDTRSFLNYNKLKALIVDDELFNRTILHNFFIRLDIDVIDTADNGENALRKYINFVRRGNHPHIVTMDLNMPVMDGKKAAEKIREYELEKGIEPCTLIIISGNCSESEIEECMNKEGRIRANAFLKKPTSINELSQVVSQHFGDSALRPNRRHFTV